jgi:hypothetical protein
MSPAKSLLLLPRLRNHSRSQLPRRCSLRTRRRARRLRARPLHCFSSHKHLSPACLLPPLHHQRKARTAWVCCSQRTLRTRSSGQRAPHCMFLDALGSQPRARERGDRVWISAAQDECYHQALRANWKYRSAHRGYVAGSSPTLSRCIDNSTGQTNWMHLKYASAAAAQVSDESSAESSANCDLPCRKRLR